MTSTEKDSKSWLESQQQPSARAQQKILTDVAATAVDILMAANRSSAWEVLTQEILLDRLVAVLQSDNPQLLEAYRKVLWRNPNWNDIKDISVWTNNFHSNSAINILNAHIEAVSQKKIVALYFSKVSALCARKRRILGSSYKAIQTLLQTKVPISFEELSDVLRKIADIVAQSGISDDDKNDLLLLFKKGFDIKISDVVWKLSAREGMTAKLIWKSLTSIRKEYQDCIMWLIKVRVLSMVEDDFEAINKTLRDSFGALYTPFFRHAFMKWSTETNLQGIYKQRLQDPAIINQLAGKDSETQRQIKFDIYMNILIDQNNWPYKKILQKIKADNFSLSSLSVEEKTKLLQTIAERNLTPAAKRNLSKVLWLNPANIEYLESFVMDLYDLSKLQHTVKLGDHDITITFKSKNLSTNLDRRLAMSSSAPLEEFWFDDINFLMDYELEITDQESFENLQILAPWLFVDFMWHQIMQNQPITVHYGSASWQMNQQTAEMQQDWDDWYYTYQDIHGKFHQIKVGDEATVRIWQEPFSTMLSSEDVQSLILSYAVLLQGNSLTDEQVHEALRQVEIEEVEDIIDDLEEEAKGDQVDSTEAQELQAKRDRIFDKFEKFLDRVLLEIDWGEAEADVSSLTEITESLARIEALLAATQNNGRVDLQAQIDAITTGLEQLFDQYANKAPVNLGDSAMDKIDALLNKLDNLVDVLSQQHNDAAQNNQNSQTSPADLPDNWSNGWNNVGDWWNGWANWWDGAEPADRNDRGPQENRQAIERPEKAFMDKLKEIRWDQNLNDLSIDDLVNRRPPIALFARGIKSPLPWGWHHWYRFQLIVERHGDDYTFGYVVNWGAYDIGHLEWHVIAQRPVSGESLQQFIDTFYGNVYKLAQPENVDGFIDQMKGMKLTKKYLNLDATPEKWSWVSKHWSDLVNSEGEKIEYIWNRTLVPVTKDWEQTYQERSILYKVKFDWNFVTVSDDEIWYTRKMDYSTFMMFCLSKQLGWMTQEEASKLEYLDKDIKVKTPWKKRFFLLNVAALAKVGWNIKEEIKYKLKKKDELKAKKMYYHIVSSWMMGALWKVYGPLWELKVEAFNELDSALWQNISGYREKLAKEWTNAKEQPDLIKKVLLDPNASKKYPLKAAWFLLFALEKWPHPYFRTLSQYANQWLRVRAILWESHQAKFFQRVAQLEQKIANDPNNLTLKDDLVKAEMYYLKEAVGDSKDKFWTRLWGEIENLTLKMLSSSKAWEAEQKEWEKNNFDFQLNDYRGFVNQSKWPDSLGALKALAQQVDDDSLYVQFVGAALYPMITGAHAVMWWSELRSWYKSTLRNFGLTFAEFVNSNNPVATLAPLFDYICYTSWISDSKTFFSESIDYDPKKYTYEWYSTHFSWKKHKVWEKFKSFWLEYGSQIMDKLNVKDFSDHRFFTEPDAMLEARSMQTWSSRDIADENMKEAVSKYTSKIWDTDTNKDLRPDYKSEDWIKTFFSNWFWNFQQAMFHKNTFKYEDGQSKWLGRPLWWMFAWKVKELKWKELSREDLVFFLKSYFRFTRWWNRHYSWILWSAMLYLRANPNQQEFTFRPQDWSWEVTVSRAKLKQLASKNVTYTNMKTAYEVTELNVFYDNFIDIILHEDNIAKLTADDRRKIFYEDGDLRWKFLPGPDAPQGQESRIATPDLKKILEANLFKKTF